MDKTTFKETLINGKWFVNNFYGNLYLVKMKQEIDIFGRGTLNVLWLSYDDPESMCYKEFNDNEWDYIDGMFKEYSCFNFSFGLYDDSSNDSSNDNIIHFDKNNGELIILEDVLKNIILNECNRDFISKNELDLMWYKLKIKDLNDIEYIYM